MRNRLLRRSSYPQLTVIAQQIKEGEGKRDGQMESLKRSLPQTFSWANDSGTIEYKQHFLRALVLLSKDEREQVVGQLGYLASQGPEYASLHMRKSKIRMPYTPENCMVSRGADDLRFTWKKNGSITVYWLYRKGDSRVRQSER